MTSDVRDGTAGGQICTRNELSRVLAEVKDGAFDGHH